MAVNDDLLDLSIRHAALLERFKTHEVRKIMAVLNDDVLPDLLGKIQGRLDRIRLRGFDRGPWTTQRYRDLLTTTRGTLTRGFRKIHETSKADLLDLARSEASWAGQTLSSAIPFEFATRMPALQMLRSAVVSRPFAGKHLREWWKGQEGATRAAVEQQLRIGLTTGETTQQIVRRLQGTRAARYADGILQTTRRQTESVVRTAVTHVSARAREATYAANESVIKGVQWVSTLDARTTDICASLDGRVFKMGQGIRPPAHMACRSTTVPVTKSWKELGIKGLKEPTPGTRASMSGQVPAQTTYGDWLRKQPIPIQEEVLGKGRAQLFRRGVVPMEKFVDPAYRPLTLRQLERLEAKLAGRAIPVRR